MRGRALAFVFVVSVARIAAAQATWQPTSPPLVTAENETWYRGGEPIEWNGALYYPAGAPEAFNRYQMVRAGSYRGIPLYTDATLEPYSIVFVPIASGRMQPYELPRTGMLAGTQGSRSSSLPRAAATEPIGPGPVSTEGIRTQAAAPPTFARAYDLSSPPTQMTAAGTGSVSLATLASNSALANPPAATVTAPPTANAVGTSGRSEPRAVGTSGRTVTTTNAASTAARPQGLNGSFIQYSGSRWVSSGRAVDLTSDFAQVGEYRGFPVYQRGTDSSTIYVPSVGTLLVPYRRR